MPEYLSPGVYVEEIEIGAKPIEGVSTSTAGFLGETERGLTLPKLITSWTQYQRVYGGYFGADKYLPYAVEGFFKNGGQRCYIAKIVGGITENPTTAKNASATLLDEDGKAALKITAIGEGRWGNRVVFKVSEASISGFKLSLFYWSNEVPTPYFDPQIDLKSLPRPSVEEVYDNLSLDETSPDFFDKKVNGLSNLITVSNDDVNLSDKIPVQQGGNVTSAKNATITVVNDLTDEVGKEIIAFDNKFTGQIREISTIDANNAKIAIVNKSWDDDLSSHLNYIITDTVVQYGKIDQVSENTTMDITLSSEWIFDAADASNGNIYIEISSGEAVGKIYEITEGNATDTKKVTITNFGSDPKPKKNDTYRILKALETAVAETERINATITLDINIEVTHDNKFITVVDANGNRQTNTLKSGHIGSGAIATVSESWSNPDIFDGTYTYNFCCGQLSEGDEKEIVLNDYKGKETEGIANGLEGFKKVDNISIVYAPNAQETYGLARELLDHCENMKDRFAIIDSKQTSYDVGTLDPRTNDNLESQYAAFYYPWIKIIDPQSNMKKLIPPGGYMAGIYARSDVERGVHKAPANETVRGVIDLQFPIGKGEQDVLNPRGVNCIRAFPGRGIRVWGARTLSSDPSWKYINVRRLFLYLEESIDEGTQWVVFEPNSEILWARVIQTISNFLKGVWKSGALMGLTPEEAFFVKCDRTTMTQDDIDNGRLIVMIGVAPVKPAEFVIFRIAQWTNNSE